ncbi:uncharacterized protein LOC134092137 [Sardina pilchardus]|uniref:uncharacterized protein LOC134092137 n=1 Tax=Sardina pilchardus TaxID=27697 RepID=UPI002E0E7D25
MERFKIRVIVTDQDVEKVALDVRPQTVEELKEIVRRHCNLQYEFNMMYEDPDFGNALCNLNNMDEVPAAATVKVVPLITSVSPEVTSNSSDISISSADTVILPSSSRTQGWPEVFSIPNFSVDVEFRLRQANLAYLKDNKTFKCPWDIKRNILQVLSEEIYKFDTYPDENRLHEVARALIGKHPCLTEAGCTDGCSGWKNSLYYKMGNFRTKLRKAGCAEVSINSSKNTPGVSKGLKRPKRCEVNFLPELPEREETLEAVRFLLAEEMKKKNPNATTVASKMDQTFSLRRREIVDVETPVETLKERWPALFTERQVFSEFNRIAATNLNDFFEALDRYTPKFVSIFKTKGGGVGETLTEFLQQIDLRKQDVTALRTLVLRGLPVLLGDDPSDFYKTCSVTDDDGVWAQVSIGLLTVVDEDAPVGPNVIHLEPVSTAIIIEGSVIMDDLKSLPEALCILFGLSYALHLDYPKSMKNTLNFIQKVMLGLGHNKLPPKLQSLKNVLLS